MKFVEPKVFLIGYTCPNTEALFDYLQFTDQADFIGDWKQAAQDGVHPGEALCSFYAKLCYKSLVTGKNKNITRTRDIINNIESTFDSKHGSVFEHCQLNFVITNCSRVFTHELVRHRVGTAFSQTSGRYVRGDSIDFIFDPILEPVREDGEILLKIIEEAYHQMVKKLNLDNEKDFNIKKKKTSALRRFLPNGQSNEMGFSVNLRQIRHIVEMRSSRHAEWEIRFVTDQMYRLLKSKFPMMFYGGKEEVVDGLYEITNLRV